MVKQSILGKVGLVLGIIAICCFLLAFILPAGETYHIADNLYAESISIFPYIFFNLSAVLGILTTILGAVEYWVKGKEKIGLVAFIFGIIIIIIWICTYLIMQTMFIMPG